MRILVDTNVLGRLSQPDHPLHRAATVSVDRLRRQGDDLRIVPQILYEYWAIATRSVADNGLGFTIEQAQSRLQLFKSVFPLLRDERGIVGPWESLVVKHAVQGKNTHDARLVAAMERHGLTHLLTFNLGDFARYEGIGLLDPQSVATA